MNPWLRLLAVLAAVVVAALLLKVVPPIVVLVAFIGGVAYVNQRLKRVAKAEARGDAVRLLGLRREGEDPFGLLGYPFALFERGADAKIENLSWGTWRGLEVRRFDVSFEHPLAPATGERPRFGCVLAPLGAEAPHVVIEPVTFVMRLASEAQMPQVEVPEQLARAFVVRSDDAAFARGLLGEDLTQWLVALGEDHGFEVAGQAALLYGPSATAGDVVAELETLQGFLEHTSSAVGGASAGPPNASMDP